MLYTVSRKINLQISLNRVLIFQFKLKHVRRVLLVEVLEGAGWISNLFVASLHSKVHKQIAKRKSSETKVDEQIQREQDS